MTEPDGEDRTGELLGGLYRLEALLGQGATAQVYRAEHTLSGRIVAVKILRRGWIDDGTARERFRREAEHTAALHHPRIVEIFENGVADDGTPYLVMELLDGAPLDKVLAKGAMPVRQAVRLAGLIAEGLARAHDLNVVHRDLKPANIFVVREGATSSIKLMDFGIAHALSQVRLTGMGQNVGTPPYMSPEAVMHQPAHPSMDLYSLGCVLFEMLTGRTPFVAETPMAHMIAHLKEQPVPPSSLRAEVPRRLDAFVLSLLAKDPKQRPVDARAASRALAALELPAERVSSPSIYPAEAETTERHESTSLRAAFSRWNKLTTEIELALKSIWPEGDHPATVKTGKLGLERAIQKLDALQRQAQDVQKTLDAQSAELKEARGRIHHAMDELSLDFSGAREELRRATVLEQDAMQRAEEQKTRYLEAMTAIDDARTRTPDAALVERLREAAQALELWLGAQAKVPGLTGARRQIASLVVDLQYQTETLRKRLGQIEAEGSTQRASLKEQLDTIAVERERVRGALRAASDEVLGALRLAAEWEPSITRYIERIERAVGAA